MSDLTTGDVAAELRTTPETVRRMIQSGVLDAYRLNADEGPFRVTPEALDQYRENQKNRDPWARSRPRQTRRKSS